MGLFDDLLGLVQKPQSIATGAAMGAIGQLTGGKQTKAQREQEGINKMLDDLQAAGQDTSEWDYLRQSVADTSNIFSGALSGAKGNLRPSDASIELAGGNPNEDRGGFGKGASMALDLAADPLLALGPAAKAGGLGKLAQGAATVGKAENLSRGQKLAQFGRQMYQGQLLSGGDPLLGLAAGLGGRQVENAAAKWGPAIARRMGGTVSEATQEGAGVAAREPLGLPPGKTRPTAEGGPVVEPSGSPWEAGPVERLALPPGQPPPSRVFEQGPVGSTGLGSEQTAELQQWLSGGPPALNRPGAIELGPAYSSGDLFEALVAERDRLRNLPVGPVGTPKVPKTDDELVEAILRLTGTSRAR